MLRSEDPVPVASPVPVTEPLRPNCGLLFNVGLGLELLLTSEPSEQAMRSFSLRDPRWMDHHAVVKETLRLHPPTSLLLPRETLEDTRLLGYDVPAGTRVLIHALAIGRDPTTWGSHAEAPERFVGYDLKMGQDFAFLPFGAGRRGCPGVGFAMMSNELALASLVCNFDWEVPGGRMPPVDMSELHGLFVRLKGFRNDILDEPPTGRVSYFFGSVPPTTTTTVDADMVGLFITILSSSEMSRILESASRVQSWLNCFSGAYCFGFGVKLGRT
ncbi:Cytochrome P450 71A4 [Hordeum vulgare]|nr:Cytochrome P450 71A4 [Hordeum vulgare]